MDKFTYILPKRKTKKLKYQWKLYFWSFYLDYEKEQIMFRKMMKISNLLAHDC